MLWHNTLREEQCGPVTFFSPFASYEDVIKLRHTTSNRMTNKLNELFIIVFEKIVVAAKSAFLALLRSTFLLRSLCHSLIFYVFLATAFSGTNVFIKGSTNSNSFASVEAL